MDALKKESLKSNLHQIAINYFEYNPFDYTRKKEYCYERQSAMYVLYNFKDNLNLTLREIGEICSSNGKAYDHTTVLHSYKTVKKDQYLQSRKDMVQRWYSFVTMSLSDRERVVNDVNKIIAKIDDNVKFSELDKKAWNLCKQILKTTSSLIQEKNEKRD